MRGAIVALGLLATACSGGNVVPHPPASAPATPPPSTFGPPDATLRPTGLIKKLPDTCQAVRPFLLPDMSDGRLLNSYEAGEGDFQECRWSSFSAGRAHVFSYTYTMFPSRDGALQDVAHRRRRTWFDAGQCRYDTAEVQDIVGLGASAFAVPCKIDKYRPDEDHHLYELRGLQLYVAVRNVVVDVQWVGAEYPAAVARKDPRWRHGGKGLRYSYDEALGFVDQVVWQVLAHFP